MRIKHKSGGQRSLAMPDGTHRETDEKGIIEVSDKMAEVLLAQGGWTPFGEAHYRNPTAQHINKKGAPRK